MAELTLQFLATPDVSVQFQPASAAGDSFSNRNGRSRGWCRNVGGLSKRVRVKRQRPDSDGELEDWDVTLPPGGVNVPIENLNPYGWNEPGTGLVHLSYPDGEAGIEVAAEGFA